MLPSIAKLASKHGIIPLKKYGQNFIYDESLCDKIVKYSNITSDAQVIEIGPGPAGLTRSILKIAPKCLIAIELDQRCIPLLNEIKEFYPQLEIKITDALKISLLELGENKFDIVANLPYNIGSKLLTNWLQEIDQVNSITVMLQKEVVDRLIAKPGTKDYGRLSVFCQVLCDINKCFDVSPKAFFPPPKVTSSVVHLVPKKQVISKDLLVKVEKISYLAFNNRRKMLRSSLKNVSNNIEQIFQNLGLDLSSRAENLTPEEYVNIAQKM